MAEAEAVENLEAVKASWQKIDDAYKTFQLSVKVAGAAFQGEAESKVGELSGSVEVCRSGDALRIFQPAKQLGMGNNDELIDCRNPFYSFRIGRVAASKKWVLLGVRSNEDLNSDDSYVNLAYENNLEFFHPLNVAGIDLLAFVERKDVEIHTQRSGLNEEIELAFTVNSTLSPDNPPYANSGKLMLSKEFAYAPVRAFLSQDASSGTAVPFTYNAKYELGNINGIPVRKAFESIRNSEGNIKQKDVLSVKVENASFQVEDEIFNLPHYGLPEPEGLRPNYTIYWLGACGMVLILIGCVFYFFIR